MDPRPPAGIDPDVPSPARVHDYALGGVHHYHADRQLAEGVLREFPEMRPLALHSRAFMGRGVRYMADEVGLRQFLDLGSGLPTQNNVHQIAQRIAPDSRVVYVDNDPIVLAHGHALLADDQSTVYADVDLRDVDAVLGAAEPFLDLQQPVGLLCVSVLHYIPDEDQPQQVMERYIDRVAPGSCMAVAHLSSDAPDQVALERAIKPWRGRQHPRPRPEIDAMFGGLQFVEPGLVDVESWRPEDTTESPGPLQLLGGVACKVR